MNNKNNYSYGNISLAIFLFYLYLSIYALIIASGGSEQSDRYYYLTLFSDPSVDVRMELGYVYLAEFFVFLGFLPFLAIFVLNSISLLLIYFVVYRINRNKIFAVLLYFPFLVFIFISVFSFIQFRAFLAISLFIFLYFRCKSWGVRLACMFILSMIHTMILPAAIFLYILENLKINLIQLFLSIFSLILFYYNIEFIGGAIGLSQYYLEYFLNDSYLSNLYFSLSVYLMLVLIFLMYKSKFTYAVYFNSRNNLLLLLLLIIFSVITGISLIIKALFPVFAIYFILLNNKITDIIISSSARGFFAIFILFFPLISLLYSFLRFG